VKGVIISSFERWSAFRDKWKCQKL